MGFEELRAVLASGGDIGTIAVAAYMMLQEGRLKRLEARMARVMAAVFPKTGDDTDGL